MVNMTNMTNIDLICRRSAFDVISKILLLATCTSSILSHKILNVIYFVPISSQIVCCIGAGPTCNRTAINSLSNIILCAELRMLSVVTVRGVNLVKGLGVLGPGVKLGC